VTTEDILVYMETEDHGNGWVFAKSNELERYYLRVRKLIRWEIEWKIKVLY